MYDYAGEWIYRVGIPAKSGVGGGIVAALPAQFGLGTFSPLLDSHGNSVRGLKVCEDISCEFRPACAQSRHDVRTSIIADYDSGMSRAATASRRAEDPRRASSANPRRRTGRRAELRQHRLRRRVRSSRTRPRPFLIVDFRRVPAMPTARRGCSPSVTIWRRTNGPGYSGGHGTDIGSPIARWWPNCRVCACSMCSTKRSNGPRTS